MSELKERRKEIRKEMEKKERKKENGKLKELEKRRRGILRKCRLFSLLRPKKRGRST
jgi:uncharacterized membrane protein (DUF106 family)